MKLEDASNGEPVGFATVSLTPAKGSAKYSLTDNEGKGTIEKVKAGTYTFKAEIMGYKTYEKSVEIDKEHVDLGTIKMELDQKVLDAAQVTATGNPIIIKKDTVEYNDFLLGSHLSYCVEGDAGLEARVTPLFK